MTIVSPWQFDGLISSGLTTTSAGVGVGVGVGDGSSSSLPIRKYAAEPALALMAKTPIMANAIPAPPLLPLDIYGIR